MPSTRASLARQFALAAALLAGFAVLLVAVASWWWIARLQNASALALVEKDVELRAASVGATLAGLAERMDEVARSPLLSTALTDSQGRDVYLLPYLGGIQVLNGVPVELLLVDFQGQEIARNGDSTVSAEQREWLRQRLQVGKAGAVVVRESAQAARAGQEVLLVAEMVRYPRTKTVEGAVLVKLSTRPLLADPAFKLVAGTSPMVTPGAGAKPIMAAVAVPPLFGELKLTVLREGAAGLPGSSGVLAVWLLLAAGGLVAAVALLGHRLAQGLTSDLRALDHFTQGVAGQAFGSARAPLAGAHEVASLAQSVNLMLERLNAQHTTLQNEAKAQLQLLGACISRLNDVVMITEAQPADEPGHRIVFVNEAFMRLTGYAAEEVIGRSPRFLQGPATDRAELDRIRASIDRWQPVRAELVNYTKAGEPFWVELDIAPVNDASGRVTHWVSIERNIGERKQAEAERSALEAQVRESQKMEAIGTLAGGVAHDFNNILGAILGNLALVRQDLADGGSPGARLDQVQRSAERARGLVQQILTFSRRQPQQLVPLALGPLLEETVALLRAGVPARVQLATNLPPRAEPLHVQGNATALEQVLMNLGTNAWQALQGSSGRIEFGLDAVDFGPGGKAGARPASLANGRHAHLWVRDDGCGMDAPTIARIFDPFFTTKPVGSGTGLGLSVVLGIVRAHGGAITVDSAPGAGTTFHVYLPLTDAVPADATGTVAGAGGAAPGRGEHVLYIDDDEVMSAVAAALLGRGGYRVTLAHDAAAGLAALRADPQAFAVIVTDFNMPGSSGLEVLRDSQAIRPDLPVILTSGYLPDEVREAAMSAGACGLLYKENTHEELVAMVAKALRG